MGFTRGSLVPLAFVVLGMSFASEAAAQWLNTPTPGVPRKADGKVDMTAPAPRMADGKPDLSGIWATAGPNRGPQASARAVEERSDDKNIAASRQMRNIGIDLPGGLPYQPWQLPIVKERTD